MKNIDKYQEVAVAVRVEHNKETDHIFIDTAVLAIDIQRIKDVIFINVRLINKGQIKNRNG